MLRSTKDLQNYAIGATDGHIGHVKDFYFDDAAWTVSRAQAVDENWFGPLSPHFANRIGDVIAAARGTSGVIRSVAESFLSGLIGQHGSLTPAEQLVPLLITRT